MSDMARELVCEPAAAKKAPDSSYAAQFSLPYGTAAALARKRFGLGEIEEPAYTEARLVELAGKVHYAIDPNADFPKKRTGEVIVTLKNGTQLRERNEIDPDAPAGADEIVRKFFANTDLAIDRARAEKIKDAVLGLEEQAGVQVLTALLAG